MKIGDYLLITQALGAWLHFLKKSTKLSRVCLTLVDETLAVVYDFGFEVVEKGVR